MKKVEYYLGYFFLIAFSITIFIMLILLGYALIYGNPFQSAEENCISLGFDELFQENQCRMKIGYDKLTGRNVYCYMPVEYNYTMQEWCNMELK